MNHVNYDKIQEKLIEIDNLNFVESFEIIRHRLMQVNKLLNMSSDADMIKEIEDLTYQLDDILRNFRSVDDKSTFNGIRNKAVELLRKVN